MDRGFCYVVWWHGGWPDLACLVAIYARLIWFWGAGWLAVWMVFSGSTQVCLIL